MNADILVAETRLKAQVDELLTRVMQGHDTSQAEWLIVSYGLSVVLLRALQTRQLQNWTDEA